ncbi:hypothetical protein SAY87_025662 [Trapa incisa]|uniref:Uncharacterized protein n=1 Tax=Trapa incisa TaxID=236973 RepID=A0AAN7GRB7_9MYRT|nr:hypothetical protein SAY87_025662 [Trapa incisa]
MHPYHECSEYCFRIIAEAKAHSEEKKSVAEPEQANTSNVQSYIGASKTAEDQHYGNDSAEVHSDDDDIPLVEEKLEEEFTKLTGRKKKLFELRLKMVKSVSLDYFFNTLCICFFDFIRQY